MATIYFNAVNVIGSAQASVLWLSQAQSDSWTAILVVLLDPCIFKWYTCV